MKRRLHSAAVLALALMLLVGCAPVSAPATAVPTAPRTGGAEGEVTVFAASSLIDAFREIGQQFEVVNSGSKVTFNFGASTQLRTQLEQGARADLFAAANQAEMDRAEAAGALGSTPRTFARNRLGVILPKGNPGRVGELKDIGRPGLKFVTAAPEVPIGVYTGDMLAKMSADPSFGPDFKDRVESNVVSREPNVRQVVAKISLGEADAAIVYASDVTPDLAPRLETLEVPDRFNILAGYPIAVVRGARNAAGAEAFMAYVLGPHGQAALKKWGFIPVAG